MNTRNRKMSGILLHGKGIEDSRITTPLSELKRVPPAKSVNACLLCFAGTMIFLLLICVGLFAAEANSIKLLDSAVYYSKLKEKEDARIQRALELQTLVAGLIAFSEGRCDKALSDLQAAGQSEYVKRLVNSQVKGGLDGLIMRCRQAADRPEPEICPACGGAGLDMCAKCRGIGKTKDDSVCIACRGLGAKVCPTCEGWGTTSPQKISEPDPAIEALIFKALYLKNGGVDLFTP